MERVIEILIALAVLLGGAGSSPAADPAAPHDEAVSHLSALLERLTTLQDHVAAMTAFAECVVDNATSDTAVPGPDFDPTAGCDRPAVEGGAEPADAGPPEWVEGRPDWVPGPPDWAPGPPEWAPGPPEPVQAPPADAPAAEPADVPADLPEPVPDDPIGSAGPPDGVPPLELPPGGDVPPVPGRP